MSDFSDMEQTFALPAMTPQPGAPALPAAGAPAPARLDVGAEELRLHGVKTAREIADVMHLRRQIKLPAHVLADPGFAMLEKKETGPASWRRFAGAAAPSAR